MHFAPDNSTSKISTFDKLYTNILIKGICLHLYSNKGTTQGDPLAMPFYALATIHLIQRLPTSVTQAWYADNASACGSLRNSWDQVSWLRPQFNYFSNAKKM